MFLGYKLKKFRAPPCRQLGFRPGRRKLIRRGKNMNLKRGEGMIEMHNIYPWVDSKKISMTKKPFILYLRIHGPK